MTESGFAGLSRRLADLGVDRRYVPRMARVESSTAWSDFVAEALQRMTSGGKRIKILVTHDGVPKVCGGSLAGDVETPQEVTPWVVEGLRRVLRMQARQSSHDVVDWRLDPASGYPESLALATREAAERLAAQLVTFVSESKVESTGASKAASLAAAEAGSEVEVLVLALGSGSLVDVTKHAVLMAEAHVGRLCFWVVPTALTVTAFTSAFAVLGTDGHKVTYPSRLPDQTVFVVPILEGAPLELHQAGVGDLVAGFVSYADWFLASELGLAQDYNPTAVALMTGIQRGLLSAPSASGIETFGGPELCVTLAAAGIAMNLGGSSAPQSGGEHATSHVLDLLRHVSQRPRWLHGLQVALTSQFSCALYDWVKEIEFIPAARISRFEHNEWDELVDRTFWLAPFSGSPREFGDSLARQQWIQERRPLLEAELARVRLESWEKALAWREVHARIHDLQARWPQIKEELTVLTLTPREFEVLALRWGLSLSAEDMQPPGHVAEVRWALRFSVFFRRRFGIQDLVFWLGEDPVLAAAL